MVNETSSLSTTERVTPSEAEVGSVPVRTPLLIVRSTDSVSTLSRPAMAIGSAAESAPWSSGAVIVAACA